MWPEGIQPESCSFGRKLNDGILESPTTRLRQVVRRARPQWTVDLRLQVKPWHVSEARFQLERLEGGKESIQVRDYAVDLVRRSGITLLSASAVASYTISTVGWTSSEAGVVRAGQYISIGRALYTARDTVDANIRGEATIYLTTPVLLASAAGSSVGLCWPYATLRQDGTSWSGTRSVDTALWSASLKLVERIGDSA